MALPIEWTDLDNYIRQDTDGKNKYITELYKNYYMYWNDRREDLRMKDELWRSNLRSPMTNMFQSRLYNMVMGSETKFVAFYTGQIETEENAARITWEMLDWMDYCWKKEETQSSFESAVFDAGLIWWGVVKIWYLYNKRNRKYLKKDWSGYETREVVKDYPVLYYISPYNMYIDPGAKTIDEARFIAERKLLNDKQIESQYKIYGITISPEMKKKFDNSVSNFIDQYDYESLKKRMPFYGMDMERNIVEDDTFRIKDSTREVIELHTKDEITIFVNGIKLGTYKQIGPYESYKFKVINFKRNPGTIYSLGTGYIVNPLQQMYDKITNLRLDNVTLTVNKVFLSETTMNIMGNSSRMKLRPGQIIKVQDIKSIEELQMTEIKESAYRETDVMFNLAQGATWVSNYALWVQDKVERVAGATDMLQGSLDSQVKPLIDSMTKVMWEVMKEFLILSLAYTDDSEFDKVLWQDNLLKNVDIDKIIEDYGFDFQIDSQQNKNQAVENQQLLDMLRMAPMFVDATGKPLLDVRDIVEKLWAGFGLDTDKLLSVEEFQNMQIMNQQLAQGPGGQAQMRALQGQWAAIPAQATTNAAGVNA